MAWFGIRINTIANSRSAFSALKGNPLATLGIPLRSGMSVGLLLVCVELFFMICILMFLPRELVGPCFIGFAIGESLGASVLRICGGIFTKIADIGSDLMKIVFKLPEDDPKNPGVIADCTGDNAGDSVGPTADGFETYGVTGVALIAFLALALAASPAICATLIIWIFVMRTLMIVTSLVSYFVNEAHQQGHVRRQEGLRLRSPADPPRLDHLGGLHRRHLRRQQAAAGRLQGRRGHRPTGTSGGCSRSSSAAAPWPAR